MDENEINPLSNLDKNDEKIVKNNEIQNNEDNFLINNQENLSNSISQGLKELEEIKEIPQETIEKDLEIVKDIDTVKKASLSEIPSVQGEEIYEKEKLIEPSEKEYPEPLTELAQEKYQKHLIVPEEDFKQKEELIKLKERLTEEKAVQEREIAKERLDRTTFKKILIFIGFIVFVIFFVYIFLNFPAIWSKLSYKFAKKEIKEAPLATKKSINSDLIFLSTIYYYPPAPRKEINFEKLENIDEIYLPSKQEIGVGEIENDRLYISKINIASPIIWDSPVDEATMLNNLKLGVVHYKGTAKPEEKASDNSGYGNVFISGHSSYYWWDDGKYKTIFANLDSLEKDDEIIIGYNNKAYVYKIYDKIVVSPEEVNVVNQNTSEHQLSLMTCVPIGTNINRLVIKSKLLAIGK